MTGIRFHGRGGQGAVVASKILAQAYFAQGFFVQAFPSFGMERKGAAVAAYVRIGRTKIHERGEIKNPAVVIVLDPTLLQMVDVTRGLDPGGLILLNSPRTGEHPPLEGDYRIACVDAGRIAVQFGLGTKMSPIVNTIILGAYAESASDLDSEHLVQAILNGVPVKPEENVAAALAASQSVRWLRGARDAA